MALFLSFSFAFCSAYFLTGQNNLVDLNPKQNCDFLTRGVLDLLNCVLIHARLDCFSRSITMEALRPARYKTAKIHRIEHTPGDLTCGIQNFRHLSDKVKCTKSGGIFCGLDTRIKQVATYSYHHV